MGLVWCEHNTAGSRCYTGDMRVGKQRDCSVLAAEFDISLRFKLRFRFEEDTKGRTLFDKPKILEEKNTNDDLLSN